MKPYGTCPECRLDYTVNNDDRLRVHGCPGSGTLIPRSEQHATPQRPATTPVYHPWDPAVQAKANDRRRSAAASRDIELAGKLLASGWLDDRAATIATTRVQHPGWTWRQIGAHLGENKDRAVSLFRRRCVEAGLR